MTQKKKIMCLMGPTAAGKTPLAIHLVQTLPLDIISVDSAMVYKDMNIGTAKPDAKTLQIAPHRLIDILDPADIYSVGKFREDAMREIEMIHGNNRIPFLVGGTMMYFRALTQGLANMPAANEKIRLEISEVANEKGWEYLHAELAKVDAQAAARIHANDSQRIQRALEVFYLTQKNITTWQQEQNQVLDNYEFHYLVVAPSDRNVLHARIAARFAKMLEEGFIEEVRALKDRGDLSLALPSMRSVGYKEMWQYLDGEISFEVMQEMAIAATRQLAKRQLTWLRSWPNAKWFDSEDAGLVKSVRMVLC